MLLLLTSLLAFGQEGTMPDWANKNGAVGVGANTTIGGANGLSFRTYVSPLFGIQGTIGIGLESFSIDPTTLDGDEFTVSVTTIAVGAYGAYKIAYWQRGSLAALFGADVQSLSAVFNGDADTDTSSTNVVLGLGLQGEWFPTQYLSLYAQGGLRMDFLNEDDVIGVEVANASPPGAVTGVDLLRGDDLFGTAGFTVWFN